MQLVPKTISGYLRGQPAPTPHDKLRIGREICQGLSFMHSKGLIHADIKTVNIGLTEENTVKIIDFGSCERTGNDVSHIDGTPNCLAPECHAGNRHPHLSITVTAKIDVYAFGITFWQIWRNNEDPYVQHGFRNRVEFLDAVSEGLRPDVRFVPRAISDLVQSCWDADPGKRPDMDRLIGRFLELEKLTAEQIESNVVPVGEAARRVALCSWFLKVC
jgi:serine/threonine protein kinase